MSKYSSSYSSIYYEDSDIPINKLNIRNKIELEKIERDLLLKSYEFFHNKLDIKTVFNEKYLLRLHRKTFSSLYEFAGQYRNFDISKGYIVFCPSKNLHVMSESIFNQFKAENYLKDYSQKPKKDFSLRLAYYLCELNALHPFPEFNGRIIRLFFDMITSYNGYDYIDYNEALKIVNGQNLFIDASIDCMTGSGVKMYNIIFNGLNKL